MWICSRCVISEVQFDIPSEDENGRSSLENQKIPENKSETYLDLIEEFRKYRKETTDKLDRILKNQDSMNEIIKQLDKKYEVAQEEIKTLKAAKNETEQNLKEATVNINKLGNSIVEQKLIENHLEIHGIPEEPQENTVATVLNLCKQINCQIQVQDIENCYRVKSVHQGEITFSSKIIVSLTKNLAKEHILQCKKSYGPLYFEKQHQGRQVYINERLTKHNAYNI